MEDEPPLLLPPPSTLHTMSTAASASARISGSAQRYLWFVLPSAALTIPASLVEFAIVRHIYNKFKIDNGVV